MLIMGIDTSTELCALGLIDDGLFIGEVNVSLERRHSERLLPNIDHLLQESGRKMEELDGLAVTIGPGSFTGLRIGLSTAKAFAQVLGIPAIGLSTLDVLASNLGQVKGWLVPIIDARRNRVYTSLYQGGEKDIIKSRIWDDQVLVVDKLLERLENLEPPSRTIYLVGNGVNVYRKNFNRSKLDFVYAQIGLNHPRGVVVAELGWHYLKLGRRQNLVELLPNYLKKAQAEINFSTI